MAKSKETTPAKEEESKDKEKKPCPISKKDFREKAKALPVTIDGRAINANVKEFSTGSFGWYLNEKIKVTVGGVEVVVQVGLNLTVVGSKTAE